MLSVILIIKRFDDVDIDWSIIGKQLLEWGDLFRYGIVDETLKMEFQKA